MNQRRRTEKEYRISEKLFSLLSATAERMETGLEEKRQEGKRGHGRLRNPLFYLAGATRLELATSGLTGLTRGFHGVIPISTK